MSIADDHSEIDRLLQGLLTAYETAGDRIDQELASIAAEASQRRRRARLKELAAEIRGMRDQLDAQVQDFADTDLRSIYQLGGTTSGVEIGVAFSWTQIHEAAVAEVAKDTLGSLLDATQHMESDVKRLVRASTKQATLDKLLLGQTATQAGEQLAGELAKNAISAVVYKNGSRHGIKDYADMVLRTNTALAYNRGTIEQGEQNGGKYAIIHDGSECCLYSHFEGPKANNLIVDLKTALTYSIAHPRCRRSYSVLMEVQTAAEAKQAMSDGTYATSAAQDRAQRTAEQARTAHLARLNARQKRLEARAAKLGSQ